MKSIRETITKAIENSQVDHIVTQQSADELIEELLAALEAEYETPQEMIDRYFAIASEVELAEYFKVIVAQDKEKPFGRWYYQISFGRIDVITGVWGTGYGGMAYLSPHASDNELVQTIFGLYKGVWEHEARESFMWNDRRVFGPHIATQSLGLGWATDSTSLWSPDRSPVFPWNDRRSKSTGPMDQDRPGIGWRPCGSSTR